VTATTRPEKRPTSSSSDLTDAVRCGHPATGACKRIVRQLNDRRIDVVQAAATLPNISAKQRVGTRPSRVTEMTTERAGGQYLPGPLAVSRQR
jgi:hypothetical protein